ncbi:Ig domain-containing protein [Dyadobacter sandarakinus]|uniref:Ig domain-containing protein n=1 Tax=Dyadobacter sandarakinus TaxID=2747268 RepID=A0ABX7I4W2_9BACT|nr:Ig domain-containing protein [Dyadobacter sandarakinus]QRR00066.1 putative Ig domain-containing protein [Dyadobacter sandarakinus]
MTVIFSYNLHGRNILALCFIIFILFPKPVLAQPPSAFTYPSPVAYIANVSNVFISPTVSGTVTSYSMPASPALPAGLTFNPNTGVISGVPTEALPATVFTVTATNESGSVSTSFTMTITNNYLNNNNNQVHFGGAGVTISHPSGSPTGQVAGDITLYQNVATISGQTIDCIITTKAVNNVSSWIIYDQPDVSGSSFNSNSPDFFSPQMNFGTGGGYVSYEFQFIFGGTYNSTTKTGQNVVLQNVKLNTYDIDGNGNTDAYQYNEFSGFSTSELGVSPTVQAVYNNETGLTRFVSTTNANSLTVTAAATRVRVSYANMSNFSIVVGSRGVGIALFFLDFSVGSTFTSVTTSSPSVDLNTSIVGITNEGAGCAGSLPLTRPSQTNINAQGSLTGMEVSYPASDIRDGAAELLTAAGATGSNVLSLGFTTGSSGTLTIGGVTFNYTKSVSGVQGAATNKIAFTRSTGGTTFTSAEAETLLDALQYSNTAANPTIGDRHLSVLVYNAVFKSPSAMFSATVNCVTLAGHIFKDQNGLLGTTDFNTISANATTGQFAAGAAYAVVVDPATNQVIESRAIAAGGAFNFGTVTPGSYFLYVSATAPAAGSVFTQATFPSGYVSAGENLSAAPGSDLLNDGKLIVTVGTTPVTNANFGLNSPPTANPLNAAALQNPGGTQRVVVPALTGNDPEQGALAGGTGNGIIITTFPTNARLFYNDVEITPESAPIQNYQPALLT